VDGVWEHSFLRDEASRSLHKLGEDPSIESDIQIAHPIRDLQLLDVATGLEFIHNNGVIHGDLKGVREPTPFNRMLAELGVHQENILVDSNYTARLADFGLASVAVVGVKIPGFSFSVHRGEGTYAWMAPELLATTAEDVPKSKSGDIYATGMVIYEVIASCLPPLRHFHPSFVGDISWCPLPRA